MASHHQQHPSTADIEKPQCPEPVALVNRRSRSSCNSSRHSRRFGFSWFRLSAGEQPWGPVGELSLYMGTAFSSIPDNDESMRSPYDAPWELSIQSEKGYRSAVDWEGPQDHEDPTGGSTESKWVRIVLVSMMPSSVQPALSVHFVITD